MLLYDKVQEQWHMGQAKTNRERTRDPTVCDSKVHINLCIFPHAAATALLVCSSVSDASPFAAAIALAASSLLRNPIILFIADT